MIRASHSFALGAVGRGRFAQNARIRLNRTTTNGQFAFAQGVEHPQFFRNGPRGQVTPLAFVPHDPYRAQLAALAAQVRARVSNDRDELLGNVAVLARVHASAAVDA